MVTKQQKHTSSAHKHVKLKAHHAKPYRKRHVGLLFVSLAALIILSALLVQYRDQIISGLSSSKTFVSDLFPQNNTYDVNIKSSYGFNVSYDQKTFYASAISNDSGDLYIGSELGQQHAYNIVRIAPNFASGTNTSTAGSTMTLTLHPGGVGAKDTLDAIALQDGGIDSTKVMRVATTTVNVGGQVFQKNTWQSKLSNALSPALTARFVTYSGLVRGDVFTIAMSLGVTGTDESVYLPVLNTLSFDNTVGFVATPTDVVVAKVQASRSLLDTLTNTGIAAAASKSVDLTGSEKVAALYSPAVVKIYNAYCMDISIDGKAYGKGYCSAASGSGFFVSQDGYLVTNGHVASTTPLDLVITDALSQYVNKGETKYLDYLLSLTALKNSDFPTGSTPTQVVGIMVDAIYKLDATRFTATNDVENLLVQVTPKNPDITALLQDTKDRTAYASADTSVLKAKLVAANYRANDGYDGFKASDVAIIKVSGENFPIVKLGSISTAAQGSDLSILGYPGNASDNGIVDSTSSEATLTTGKVSSIKNASGSDKKLIETDTTIGHGNSGGPALADNGEVVGIATYTADGSGEGNGVFNYIRDIKDLTDLASARNISFDTNSATQAAWQEGITNYYTSHYSKALKNFAVVEKLYPNDSKVASFTASAQKNIADGKDVVDFPLIPVIIVAVVVLAGIGFGLFFIVRHHKKHVIYNAGVAQGTVQPVGPGVPTQIVTVSHDGPTVGVPLVSAPVIAASVVPEVVAQPVVAPIVEPMTPVAVEPDPVQELTTPVPPTQPEAPQPTVITVQSAPEAPVEPVTPPAVESPAANPWFTPDNTQNDPPK
ncbi:MAG TPA: trypsin-like peptidase domain-containing protein [Candidatus Microsaccharimonas sp.]|jgi:S1-C subfamily serine protease